MTQRLDDLKTNVSEIQGKPTRINADGRMGHRRGWRYNRGRDGGVLNRPFRAEMKGVAAASPLAFLAIDTVKTSH